MPRVALFANVQVAWVGLFMCRCMRDEMSLVIVCGTQETAGDIILNTYVAFLRVVASQSRHFLNMCLAP